MPDNLYAGYFPPDGGWKATAPEWTDIKQCPRDRVYRMMEAGNTDVILGLWGTHAGDGRECWVSAVDPYLELRPRWFRDMVRPPGYDRTTGRAMTTAEVDRFLGVVA